MIKIRTTAIGEGRPKICIPLVSDSTELLALECMDLAGTPFDLLEWRVDYLAASQNFQMEKNLKEGYEAIRSVFPDAPVLTTVRSEPQGGARDFTEAEYIDLLSFITKEHLGDAVDIEYGQEVFDTYEMIREAKRADMPVVMSWHSLGRVMGVREIIDVIENMQAMDADILKVATIVEHPKEAALVMYAAAEAQEEFRSRHGQSAGYLLRKVREIGNSKISKKFDCSSSFLEYNERKFSCSVVRRMTYVPERI